MKREVLPPRHPASVRAVGFAAGVAMVWLAAAGAVFGVADCASSIAEHRRAAILVPMPCERVR